MNFSQMRFAYLSAVAASLCVVVSLTPLQAHARNAPRAFYDEPVTYVVVYKSDAVVDNTDRLIRRAGGQVVGDYPEIGVTIANSELTRFPTMIKENPAVLGAGRPTGEPMAKPSKRKGFHDVEGSLEWFQWDMKQIGVDQAHAITKGSRDVLVGVLDSGVAGKHPNLAPNFDAENSASCVSGKPDTSADAWEPTPGYNFSSHGTHVAGTIAAAELDDAGIVGVAPKVRIASVKVGDDHGLIYPQHAICGLMWAAERGMDITNNSYFVDPWKLNEEKSPDDLVAWEGVRRALAYSQSRGVLHIAGVGNEDTDLATRKAGTAEELPVESPGVVGVSAVGMLGSKASYSSFGAGVVDVTAPGGDQAQWDLRYPVPMIMSTVPGDGYDGFEGTSMATPHVTGVAALIKSAFPNLTAQEIAKRLQDTADPVPCEPTSASSDQNAGEVPPDTRCVQQGVINNFYGHGQVNAYRALIGPTP